MNNYNKIKIGKIAENFALKYYLNKGYILLEKNFRFYEGEIDLIFKYKEKIIFVEVRSRTNNNAGEPEETINKVKIKKLYETIEYYIFINKLDNVDCELEAFCILFSECGNLISYNIYQNISGI